MGPKSTYTEPVLFTEWIIDNRLRHPRYLGLRIDESAEKMVRERATEVKGT